MPERKSPASKATGSGRAPGGSRGAAGKSGAAKPNMSKASTTKSSTSKVSTSKVSTSKVGATKVSTSKPSTTKSATRPAGSSSSRGPAQKRPARKKKSIVNQKQTPWGLIVTAVAIVAFAAAVVGVVVATHKSDSDTTVSKGGQAVSSSDPYRRPEAAAAAAISGVTYHVEGLHTHILTGHIKYDTTPPVGGDHSPYWADCTGTVYPKAIANENAVHMLEHGAVWITYNEDKLSATQVTALAKNVSGIDRMAMSPYPNLKAPISLQSWGYQLFVNSPTDPRIAQFIKALKYNQNTTPEYGATCSQPTFKSHPSTYGHPLFDAVGGAKGNTSGA